MHKWGIWSVHKWRLGRDRSQKDREQISLMKATG